MLKFFKILIFLLLFGVLAIYLELSGYVYHNDILARNYKVHGIDVSHHQIRINWKKVDKKYKFVIMKATEGKDFLDTDFYYNWSNARLNGFTVGVYHFFTMLSSGDAQADFYISKVPVSDKTLPPIIDVEVSTKIYKKDMVLKELENMVKKLESHYQKRVIFYVNYNTYNAYLKGEFPNNKLWISDFKFIPKLEENDRWVIWQVSRRGRVAGIPGYTDKNVLRGDSIEKLIKDSIIN